MESCLNQLLRSYTLSNNVSFAFNVPSTKISMSYLLGSMDVHSKSAPVGNCAWLLDASGNRRSLVFFSMPANELGSNHDPFHTNLDPSASLFLGTILPGTTIKDILAGSVVGSCSHCFLISFSTQAKSSSGSFLVDCLFWYAAHTFGVFSA